MMSRTGDRLRDVATAVGAAVTEQDLPELRLAEQLPVRRRWSGGRWLVPLVAAVSVIAAVGAAAVFGKLLAVSRDRPHSALIPGPALIRPVTGTPGYLVTSQLGRGSVISVATGRTIAKIPPPVKGYVIEGIAAAPGNRVFYLAGEVFGARGGRLEFFEVKLRPDGQPEPARRLPGRAIQVPLPVSSNGLMNIAVAVSPDGRQIAYALQNQLLTDPGLRPVTITVLSVSTGATRAWRVWSGPQTQISQLSWDAHGRIAYHATIGNAAVRNGHVIKARRQNLNLVAILSTLGAPGPLLPASRLLTYSSRPDAGVRASVITADGLTVVAQVVNGFQVTSLVEISVATGQITRVLLSGEQAFQANPVAIDGDNLLFTLSPKQEHPNASYICGHLALAKLSTGQIARLPVPVYCSTAAPPPPFPATW